MIWDKVKKDHFYKEPVEYFRTQTIFSQIEYEKLYENQNNLQHKYWQNLKDQTYMSWTYHKDLDLIDKTKDVTCLWFFKDRGDRNAGNYITCEDKVIVYSPNTFFFTIFKDYKVIAKKNNILERPVVQLDMSIEQYQKILNRFQ